MTDPGTPSGDMYHFGGGLSKIARDGIGQWYGQRDWEDIGDRSWLTIETACLMVFRLKAAEDDPLLFPHGKWATIQALEQDVLNCVKTDMEARRE